MESTMSAIEMTGMIDEEHRLVLDGLCPWRVPCAYVCWCCIR